MAINAKNLNIDWLSVGSKFNATPSQKGKLINAFERLEWKSKGEQTGFSQGFAINKIVESFQLQKIFLNWATEGDMLAVRAQYEQGVISVLVIDQGDILTPVMVVRDWPAA